MVFLRFFVRIVSLAIITAAFLGVPFCWHGVKVQGLVWASVLTLLLGRFFCSAICPLGILQSFVHFVFHPKTPVRRVCTRLPQTRRQGVVRVTFLLLLIILLLSGLTGIVTSFTPISIYGKAMSVLRAVVEGGSPVAAFPTAEARLFACISIAGLAFVLVLAAVGKGRVWCNWVCPFGTILTFVSRFSIVKDKVSPKCRACGKCFAKGGTSEKETPPKAREPTCDRRTALKGAAVLAVTEKLTDGGYAPVSLAGVPARKTAVLPPGSGSNYTFHLKCSACQLCIANCPGKCLKPSLKLNAFGQPEMDFRLGSCIPTCVRCSEICPEGALLKLQDVHRKTLRMGRAIWQKDLCIRTTQNVECTACQRKCPVEAIRIAKGVLVINETACIGCGACEHVCPSRPLSAITVEGYDEQRLVLPMSR